MNVVALIAIILIWTVIREALLDRYWRTTRNKHLSEFGNLYIVLGCLVSTVVLLLVLSGERRMTFEEWWESRGDNWHWTEDKHSASQAWEARVPEGYVIVPVDPTEAMIKSGADSMNWYDYDEDATSVYKAMIEAAQEEE